MSIRRPGSGGSREPQMADTTKAAAKAAKAPTTGEIERAREFAREPFLLEGEKPKDLAAGTPRRRALDAALAEIDEGHEAPSIEWRRDFSLMLGLERGLSEETPGLADGAQAGPAQGGGPRGPPGGGDRGRGGARQGRAREGERQRRRRCRGRAQARRRRGGRRRGARGERRGRRPERGGGRGDRGRGGRGLDR